MDPNYLILLDYNTGQIVKIKLTVVNCSQIFCTFAVETTGCRRF